MPFRFSEFIFRTVLNMEKNFFTAISNIKRVLKIWRIRNLTSEGKIIVFRTLALPKIVQLCLTSIVPTKFI